jgi:hypothetical protein
MLQYGGHVCRAGRLAASTPRTSAPTRAPARAAAAHVPRPSTASAAGWLKLGPRPLPVLLPLPLPLLPLPLLLLPLPLLLLPRLLPLPLLLLFGGAPAGCAGRVRGPLRRARAGRPKGTRAGPPQGMLRPQGLGGARFTCGTQGRVRRGGERRAMRTGCRAGRGVGVGGASKEGQPQLVWTGL